MSSYSVDAWVRGRQIGQAEGARGVIKGLRPMASSDPPLCRPYQIFV